MRTVFGSLLPLLSLLAPPLLAGVKVVNPAEPGAYTDIQTAIDQAAEDDLVLVWPGPRQDWVYPGFVVDGRGITIVGLDHVPIEVQGIRILHTPAGQEVFLSGLSSCFHSSGSEDSPDQGLTLRSCAGSIRLQACRIGACEDFVLAARMTDCADVVLVDCVIQGSAGDERQDGATGLDVVGSELLLSSSSVHGGPGGSAWTFGSYVNAGDGGDGLRLANSELWASNSSIRGGDGGQATGPGASPGDGGTGLVSSSLSSASARACEIRGGAGGEGDSSSGQDGQDYTGSLTLLEPPARELELAALVPADAQLPWSVRGSPEDRVYLLLGEHTLRRSFGLEQGMLLIEQPILSGRSFLGTIPAGGELHGSLATPHLSPGAAWPLLYQVVCVRPDGELRFSGPRLATVLGSRHVLTCEGTLHVDASAPAGGDGRSWPTAFRGLQSALAAARFCAKHAPHEIWVAQGTYAPAPPGGSRDISFDVPNDTRLLAGFAGWEDSADLRNARAHPVVLSGDLAGNDAPGFENRNDNSRTVLEAGNSGSRAERILIDGVRVRGGWPGRDYLRGAGAFLRGDVTLVRCTFVDNQAVNQGGGLYHDSGELVLESCRFLGNVGSRGGGLYSYSPQSGIDLEISNSEFSGNWASTDGGGLWASSLSLRTCTFAANHAAGSAGGVWASAGSTSALLLDSLLYLNSDASGMAEQAQIRFQHGVGTFRYCSLQGWTGDYGGEANQDADPYFLDLDGPDDLLGTLDDDLRLGAQSPCIDAAENASVALDRFDLDRDELTDEPIPYDLDGLPRFVDDPSVTDTGSGLPPLVDIGAHERQGGS